MRYAPTCTLQPAPHFLLLIQANKTRMQTNLQLNQ
jgi:hypothetical protein